MMKNTNSKPSGKIYIETYGCQMNRVDSELVYSLLLKGGYRRANDISEADIILINTCAVREHAQEKAISNISQFKKYKDINRSVRIGVLGCLSRYMGGELAERLPFLDWILGPDSYRSLPLLLGEGLRKHPLFIPVEDEHELYDEIQPSRGQAANAWITISRGCDNHCTYCVVPGTRGEERNRPVESILEEVENAVSHGFPQVTLLGQNVNSYHYQGVDFPLLMEKIAQISGVKRIRFLSSHPKDCSEHLLELIGSGLPYCPELHLAMQSGNDRILKRMGRKYTADHYFNLVSKARELQPDLLLSTDIIVGFPSETEEEFKDTESLVRRIGFDDAFIYRYSARPGTPSYKLDDDVPNEEKVRRLMILNNIVRESGLSRRKALIGKEQLIMVEGPSSKNPDELMGRTPAGYVVVFPGHEQTGSEVLVKINDISGFTLRGIKVN